MSKNTEIQNVNKQNFFIQHFPVLNNWFKSEKAALIFSHLEHWAAKAKYETGFYKFLEPCPENRLYRAGDSWLEVTGYARRTFLRAFEIFGVRYKSKTAFLKAEDKFQGKFYAFYMDRKTHKTVFIRNHEIVDAFLSEHLPALLNRRSGALKSLTKVPSHKAPLKTDKPLVEKGSEAKKICETSHSRNDTFCRSRIYIDKHKITTLPRENFEKPTLPQVPEPENRVGEEMQKIWMEEVGVGKPLDLTPRFQKTLQQSFQTFFGSSLENWRAYCRKIASSKFLMGEVNPKFRVYLQWALTADGYQRIMNGSFIFGNRVSAKVEEEARAQKIQRESLQVKQSVQIRELEEAIQDLRQERSQAITKAMDTLLAEEVDAFKAQYTAERGAFDAEMFPYFLRFKLEQQIFPETFEEALSRHIDLRARKESLMETLKSLYRDVRFEIKRAYHICLPRDLESWILREM